MLRIICLLRPTKSTLLHPGVRMSKVSCIAFGHTRPLRRAQITENPILPCAMRLMRLSCLQAMMCIPCLPRRPILTVTSCSRCYRIYMLTRTPSARGYMARTPLCHTVLRPAPATHRSIQWLPLSLVSHSVARLPQCRSRTYRFGSGCPRCYRHLCSCTSLNPLCSRHGFGSCHPRR